MTSASTSCCSRRARSIHFPRPVLDFADVHRQLQKNKHVTLQLLWEQYRETQPGGYRYSRFCELYRRWSRNQDVVLREDHKAGEKMFVDWAGPTVAIHDHETGARRAMGNSFTARERPCGALQSV